jgi:hypothetical protein
VQTDFSADDTLQQNDQEQTTPTPIRGLEDREIKIAEFEIKFADDPVTRLHFGSGNLFLGAARKRRRM